MNAALHFSTDELDTAFQNKEFVALFQPTVSLAQLRAVSATATLQWHHPALGVLDETVFLPDVTDFGRQREMTLFALRAAIRACAQWRKDGLEWTVSVRVPPTELLDDHLVGSIRFILNEANLDPELLTIDIREADLGNQTSQFLAAFTELRTLGCGLNLRCGAALSLAQDIRTLPLTELTVIGGATLQFIQRTRQAQYGIFAQRLADAQSRNIRATAAGVEDEATLWAIQRAGFAAATGNYICRPLPQKGLARWNKIWLQAAETIAMSKRETPTASPEAEPVAVPPQMEEPAPAPQETAETVHDPISAHAQPEFEPVSSADELEIEPSDGDFVADVTLETAPATDRSPDPGAPPTFLHRQPSSHLPMDIDHDAPGLYEATTDSEPPVVAESADFIEEVSETRDETGSSDHHFETDLSVEVGLETPELADESEAAQAETELDEDAADESDGTVEATNSEADSEAPGAAEPASRIDLSHWISTRSQTSGPNYNPLDDFFEGGVPPQPHVYREEQTLPPQAAEVDVVDVVDDDVAVEPALADNTPAPVVEDGGADDESGDVTTAAEAELPPARKIAPERLLEPAAARTVTSTPDTDPELVLVSRKIPGLERPIKMSVQNPGREGLSLKGLFKKRSGK